MHLVDCISYQLQSFFARTKFEAWSCNLSLLEKIRWLIILPWNEISLVAFRKWLNAPWACCLWINVHVLRGVGTKRYGDWPNHLATYVHQLEFISSWCDYAETNPFNTICKTWFHEGMILFNNTYVYMQYVVALHILSNEFLPPYICIETLQSTPKAIQPSLRHTKTKKEGIPTAIKWCPFWEKKQWERGFCF